MKWLIFVLILIFLSFIVVQIIAIRRLKSKKGKRIENIDGELGKLLSTNSKLMIYFWTENCRVCKQQTPVIKELSNEFKNIFLFNLSNDIKLARELGIMAVPTIIFFENFKVIDVLVGAQNKNNLKQKLLKFYGDSL